MSDIQHIKDKIDIVELVSEYVALKPAGVNHKGLCPFHREKSSSFMVSRERQRWHCFGCSKDGDIFTFVQEIEGMEFVEALKFLAARAGVVLTNTKSDANASQKNRLKDVNADAARFFYKFLLQMPAAGAAREYLRGRGVRDETIDAWQVGFIPDQWDLLTQYLLKKGHSIDDLVASGLTIQRDGASSGSGRGFYDRFRGRVMFPIWDVHDTVVGFTGRVLVETETSGGKYVNTPQTLIYEKSRVVFGLNRAKQAIKAADQTVMVEGQMDVIACHQAGMKNVVATSGTAMTDEQIRLLKRYSNNLAIAFDADAAGMDAAKRGIDIALSEGMNIRVVRIPEGAGKDADECLKRHPQVWFDAVANAEDIMDWYLQRALRGRDMNSPKDKQRVADEVLHEILRIPYAVERDHWLRELAGRVRVEVEVLKDDMVRLEKTEKKKPGVVGNMVTPALGSTPVQKTRLDLLAERLLILLLRYLKAGGVGPWQADLSLLLSTPSHRGLYDFLRARYTGGQSISIPELRNALPDEDIAHTIDTLLMQGDLLFSDMDEVTGKKEVDIVSREIEREWRRQRFLLLERDMAAAEAHNDVERLRTLHL